MSDSSVTFIGAGNMARSLAGGMLAQGWSAGQLRAADPLSANRARLDELGITTFTSNIEALQRADAVVLAVKPQVLKTVCNEIAPALNDKGALIISIAAGIETSSLLAWLGSNVPVVRCMPNTPALVQLGASVLYATSHVSEPQRELADAIVSTVGTSAWVDEEAMLHAVTAVSGSGPAYFFLMIEAMRNAGEQLGLPAKLSTELAVQTALGAATMASESETDVIELRRQVSSPGGTTERALASFEARDLRGTVLHALRACAERSAELARELGHV